MHDDLESPRETTPPLQLSVQRGQQNPRFFLGIPWKTDGWIGILPMTSYSPYITWLWSLLSCGVLLLRAGKLTSQMPRKSKKKVVETVPLKKIWWSLNISLITLPETNSSHLNMDAWKIKVPFGGGLFSGAKWLLVSGRLGYQLTLRVLFMSGCFNHLLKLQHVDLAYKFCQPNWRLQCTKHDQMHSPSGSFILSVGQSCWGMMGHDQEKQQKDEPYRTI